MEPEQIVRVFLDAFTSGPGCPERIAALRELFLPRAAGSRVTVRVAIIDAMSLLRTAIGTVLRRIRRAQGRTLQDVADAAGVSMPYLSEIERGRKEASSEILAGICRALGLGLPDLLDEVRLELLRGNPAVLPPRCSAVGRSALGRDRCTRGFRTPRLASCRTHRMASSFSTSS